MQRTILSQLIPFIFRVALVWYLLGALLELIFPGMISDVINLDFFLWAVILLAVFSFGIDRKRA